MTAERLAATEDVLGQAIGWAMVASEGFRNDAERRAFDVWLTSDPRHREVWRKLNNDLASLRTLGGSMSGTAMATALDVPQTDRRSALRAMGIAVLGVGGMALFGGFDIPVAMAADMRTSTGERRRFDLADGTALTLDARSRVDRAFAAGRRGVALHEGAVFAQVRSGVTLFDMRAGEVRVAIAEGDFMVSRRNSECWIISVAGTGEVTLGAETRRMDGAGHGYAVVEGSRLVPLSSNATMDAAAWLDGRLILHDRSLTDLVDAFRAYNSGLLSISDAAGELRISGIFDLDDLVGTLGMIQATHPLRVLRLGGLLCHISLAN